MILSPLFSDHMVFQQNKPIRIWGEGKGKITVSLEDETAYTVSDKKGRFFLSLSPKSAGGPYTLTLSDNDGTVTLTDIMIGEVWIAAGQSNMEMITGVTENGFTYAEKYGNDDRIRLFTVPRRSKDDFYGYNWHFEGVEAVDTPWSVCSEENALHFSAVGFYFAEFLAESRDVPVGIISCNYGATRIEEFMDTARLFERQEFSYLRDRSNEILEKLNIEEYDKAFDNYYRELYESAKNVNALEKVRELGAYKFARTGFFDWPPALPLGPYSTYWAGSLYDNMVKRIMPFSVKGVLWYQGESNVAEQEHYFDLFKGFTEQWREDFRDEDLPFLTVRIAPYNNGGNTEAWNKLAESQQRAADRISGVYIADTSDIGEDDNIHPIKKYEVGERLYNIAAVEIYGE